MIFRHIGRHVASFGVLLGKRQGLLVAAGFVLGCIVWLASWGLDYHKADSVSGVWKSYRSFELTGEWLRTNVGSRLIEASSIIALLLAYLQVTGHHFDKFRARRLLRGHVIICGMSARSQILAQDLVKNGQDVVIIDLAPLEEAAARNRQDGICVIHGDATSPDVLLAAGIVRARRVICLTGKDDTNCGVVEACRILLAKNEHGFSGELNVHCHVQSLRLRFQLAQLSIFVRGLVDPDGAYSARFRLFCIEHCAATELLQRYPPERGVPRERQTDDVHIVLLGSGITVQSLLLQIAHVCHYWRAEERFGQPVNGVRVTLVDEGAGSLWARLLAVVPALEGLVSIQLVDRSPDDSVALTQLDAFFAAHAPTQVFVAMPDATSTLSQAMLLLSRFDRYLSGWGIVAAIFPPRLNPIDLDEWNRDERLQGYDLYGACKEEMVISEVFDGIARKIHDAYFETQKGENFVEGPLDDGKSGHPWVNLNEWYRNSNRYAAAHFDVKLHAINRQRVPLPESQGEAEKEVPAGEIESLAEMEHRRWMAFHLLGGWRLGDRDDANRLHPCLKQYAELSEDEKQKDRNSVVNMPAQLQEAGFCIHSQS